MEIQHELKKALNVTVYIVRLVERLCIILSLTICFSGFSTLLPITTQNKTVKFYDAT